MRRRDFLHVGFAGGIGLTLADFFRIKEAQGAQKYYETKEGPAKSVCTQGVGCMVHPCLIRIWMCSPMAIPQSEPYTLAYVRWKVGPYTRSRLMQSY